MSAVKRDYRAQYRRGQAKLLAEGTRRVIVTSARKLFGSRGYGATTLEAIARDSGVAVQTVYANFGTKRAILLELLKLAQGEGELLAIIGQFVAEKDPVRRLKLGVAFNRAFYEQSGDVYRILLGAAASDPVIAKLEHLAEEDVRGRCAGIVRALARSGRLRKGLTQKEGTDLLATLSSPEIFRLLVTSSGWSPAEYETWLLMTFEALVLGTPLRPVLAPSRPAKRQRSST
jgi:AcrR family transcriptional regulator